MDRIELPRDQRRQGFVRLFLAIVLVGCLGIAALNYVVNPSGYYPTTWFSQRPTHDRIVKVALLRQAFQPDILVLGSSRVMKLPPTHIEAISGMHAFNAGVSSARIEDSYAMLRFVTDDLGYKPKEVVLGIDDAAFDLTSEPNEQLLLTGDLAKHLPAAYGIRSVVKRGKLLLSLTQLQDSLAVLRSHQAWPLGDMGNAQFGADGLLTYRQQDGAIAEGRFTPGVDAKAIQKLSQDLPPLGISPVRRRVMEEMLAFAQARGMRVRAFITPFHPTALATLQGNPKYVRQHEALVAYLKSLPSHFDTFSIVDLSDIASFGGTPDQFYDHVHYYGDNVDAILHVLWAH